MDSFAPVYKKEQTDISTELVETQMQEAADYNDSFGLVSLLKSEKAAAKPASADNTGKKALSKERVVNIEDADELFGWWQQKEFRKLGVERIRLSQTGAALELKQPVKKNALVATLELDKEFSFQFDNKNKWVLSHVKGLKVNGLKVDKAEGNEAGIVFWNGNQKRQFGRAAADFIKSLLDPLMSDHLRR